MALETRSSDASIDAMSAIKTGQVLPQLPGNSLEAGEDLDALAPCYIASADGKVYMCNGTAADEAAEVIGFTGKAYKAGATVSLFREGVVAYYADDFSGDDGVAPGDKLYIAATDGRLDTAATTGDSEGVAVALDNHHILIPRASF